MEGEKKMRTILIVDTDEQVAKVYRIKCEEAGFRVLVATTGTEAFDLIQKERPDGVLMDIILPGKDGFTLLEEVKAREGSTVFVVLTHLAQEKDRARAVELGARAYFGKADAQVKEVITTLGSLVPTA